MPLRLSDSAAKAAHPTQADDKNVSGKQPLHRRVAEHAAHAIEATMQAIGIFAVAGLGRRAAAEAAGDAWSGRSWAEASELMICILGPQGRRAARQRLRSYRRASGRGTGSWNKR